MERYNNNTIKSASLLPLDLSAAVVTFVFAVQCAWHYLRGDLAEVRTLAQIEWIPYDSLKYVIEAVDFREGSYTIVEIVFGSFNWQSLPLLYFLLNSTTGLAAALFPIGNLVCLYAMLAGSPSGGFSLERRFLVYGAIIVSSPFLIGWILVPNKEVPATALIVLMLRATDLARWRTFLILAAMIAPIRIQVFFGALLFFSLVRFRWRWQICFAIIVAGAPFLANKHSGLSYLSFLENTTEEIRSAQLFTHLNEINSYPLGFILVGPLRLIINCFVGIYPIRVIHSVNTSELIASLTSFWLAVVMAVVSLKIIFNRRLRIWSEDQIFLIACLLLVLALIPFLQPRYYWWLIPVCIGGMALRR